MKHRIPVLQVKKYKMPLCIIEMMRIYEVCKWAEVHKYIDEMLLRRFNVCYCASKGIVYNLGNYKRTIFQLIIKIYSVKKLISGNARAQIWVSQLCVVFQEKEDALIKRLKKILIKSKETSVICSKFRCACNRESNVPLCSTARNDLPKSPATSLSSQSLGS